MAGFSENPSSPYRFILDRQAIYNPNVRKNSVRPARPFEKLTSTKSRLKEGAYARLSEWRKVQTVHMVKIRKQA
jgi:hypothetical protein